MILKFKREIIAILLIICMLFTISVVSAADSSTDAVSATNATVEAASEDVANDNNLATENDVESLGEGESSEVGTFADLKSDLDITNAVAYSTILLNRSYKFTDSVDANGLTISKSITIDGQGHTIDANEKNRVFYITTKGVNVVLKNIIFINGKASQGGAISSSTSTSATYRIASVEIINCTFENNSATSSSTSTAGHGGAVYFAAPSNHISIINSTFINNKAYDNSGKYGGAVYINGYYATAGCKIINSTFINNYANYDGGVIWLRGKSNVNQIVDGCIFISNAGGNTVYSSVFKGDNSGNFIINNSIFLNNKKYAVNIGPSTYSLENNWWGNTEENFNTNLVNVYSKSVTSWLYLKFETDDATGTATISLNNLYSSSSGETSVYDGKFPAIEFNIESTNMNVDKNTVKLGSDGKATFHYELTGAVGVLTVSYNNINMTKTFKDLSFSSLKNMIINSQEPTICLDEDFTYDETKDSALSDGIDFAKSITIDGQGHTLNAKELKRIFYINDPTKDVVLKNINFVKGNADVGGAINAIVNSLTLINCTFINNTANTYGGAVALNANTVEITENTFTNNAGNSVIYCSGNGNYNIHDSIINAQNIAVDGENTATINTNYNWWGNTADNYDTSIVNVGSSVTRDNWLFLNMTTDDKKGLAEISLNNLYTISVGNSTYSGYALPEITLNIGSSNAKVNKNNVKIDETGKTSLNYVVKTTGSLTVSYNDEIGLTKDVAYDDEGNFKSLYNLLTNVAEEGDTIELKRDYNYDSSTDSQLANQMKIDKTLVIDGKGHTIDAKGQTNIFKVDNVKVTFKNIIFANGYSSYGGAVYYKSNIEGEFINCTFINNFASYYGGAIYDYQGSLNIVGSTFINNTASSSGSAIYAYNDVGVSNSIFVGNGGEYIIAGSGSVIANNNWWGHTIDNYETPLSIGSSVTANNWYVLNMSVDISTVSKLTLNNLYDGNDISIDNNYALPAITFNTKSTNAQLTKDNVALNAGEGNIEHSFSKKYSITASYNGVELTKSFVNIASFTELKTQINDATDELVLDQNYAFNPNADNPNDIIFSKSLTIDGAGFTIDAKGLSNIFYFNDDSNTKTLILKNIIFANATGENGAAVYFNGNRIEIVNCTFINNTANSQGAAIYVNGANNNVENKIVQSTFINNTCANSIIYLNSAFNDALFVVSDSVIVNNGGVTIAKGTGNVNADYNWWGNNATNYNINIANAGEGIAIEKWFYLNITVDDEIKKAEISLNNLNDGSDYSYVLSELIFDITAVNANLNKNSLILDSTGKNTVDYSLTGLSGLLTASYNGVEFTNEIKFIDKGDFESLQNILNLIPEGYMYKLTRNYTYSENDTITTGILVDKRIGIDGNGFTIDAKGESRIFNLAADGILLKNVNLINGKSSSGAAVYTSSNYVSIDNSTFINNTATGDGGAIYIESYYSGSITNSKFINNSADEDGAAIFTYAYYVVADIDGCIFINNTASYSSVIYAYKCKVKNSIFLDNPGNMIRGYYSNEHVINYNWFGNTFDNYVDSPSVESPVTNWLYLDIKFYEDYAVVLLNKLYNSNSASSSIFSDYDLPEITLNINSSTLDLYNVKNITLDSKGMAIVPYTMIGDSGALTVSYKDILLTKERVVGDFDNLQDLINKNDEIELDRDYTYISGVDEITGGIIINKNITIDGKGHTLDANEMSRIFNVQALNVTFKNIIFVNGKSNVKYDDGGNSGGAICYNLDNTESINFNVINCTFVDNTADLDNYNQNYPGGAIYIKANNGKFNITDSIFKNNKATGNGGAIYLNTKNSEFNLYNSSFIANTAYNGGALYIETDGTTITIDKCLFKENSQTGAVNYAGYGSAIRWITTNDDDKDNVIKNSIFLDNIPDGLNKNNYNVFSYSSGKVNINDNWWGTNALNNPNELSSNFIDGGITPTSWLYIDGTLNSSTVYVNEPVTVKFILKLYDQSLGVCDYDNDKLPFVNFTVSSYSSDYGVADKSFSSLNEEIIYVATKAAKQDIVGPAIIVSTINSREFWFKFTQKEHSIISLLVDNPLTMYNDKYYNYEDILKFNAKKSKITIESSDSSVVGLGVNYHDINALSTGTAIISFDYNDADADLYDETSVDLVINVRKIPMQIVVTNFESDEILVYATDTIYLNVTLLIDDIYEQYATNQWGSLKFTHEDDDVNGNIFYEKGSDFTANGASVNGTFSCRASQVGTSNLTLSIDNKLYDCENAIIKFTIDKKPTAIELDHADSLEFKVDDVSKINATLINGSVDAQLKYKSSNSDVVTVDENTGEFSAVGSGTAIITIKYGGNAQRNESTKEVTVTVNKYGTETVLSSHDAIELEIDETSQVSATLTAEDNADLGSPTYESSDESVATVNLVTGEITAVGIGSATITAKYDATRRYAASSDTVTVTVRKISTGITLISDSEVTIDVFADSQITATLTPSAAGSLSYKSCNESIATVDADGKITAVAGGKANITISFAGDDDRYAAAEDVNVSVTVNKLPTTITVDPTNDVDVFDSKSLGATVDNGRTLHYVSLNSDIVTVDNAGVITGVIGGTGVINISFAEDGQYQAEYATVTVTVNKIDSTITVNPIEIDVFESQLINPTIVGDGVVSYVSCDSAIVTVNSTNGNITGVKGGKANVTISIAEGAQYLAKEVNVTVTVNKLPTTITVNPTISVDVDGTNTIEATADHGRELEFVSLDETIVTVESATGVVTGVIGGTANVTVKFHEDDQYLAKEVNVTVTVNKLTPTVTVGPIEIDVFEDKSINPTVVSDGDVTYVSCNSSIVTVDELTGKITGVIGGKANVTVKVSETPRYLAKDVNVTVTVNKLPTVITVEPTMRLKMGDSETVVASVITGADIHYQTASDLITVDANGLVTALKGGIAELTVSADETDEYKANSTTVTVTVARLPDDKTPIELSVFSEADVSALYNFGGDPNNLKYISSNETIFTVTGSGVLEAKMGGEANLTIKDEILGESVTIKVIVKKLETPIKVDPTFSIDVYQDNTLVINIPQRADNGQLRYVSSNPDVVIVDENGVITGVIGGTAIITVSYVEDGQFVANSTDVLVTVNKLPTTITINEDEYSVYVDGKDMINATTNNEGGLLYASNSNNVLLSNNIVTGVSEGVAEIKVIALENEKYLAKTEIVRVTVKKIPSTITAETKEFTMDVNGNATIGAILNHEGDLTYKYNESIIKVENGVISGLIGGKTNITISYAGDNKYEAAEDVNVTVTVNKLPTTITVNLTNDVDVDASKYLGAAIDHEGTLKYESLNPDIVAVNDAGEITGIIGGTGVINISFAENEQYLAKSATVTVTVNKIASTITVSPIEMDVFESQLINPAIVGDGEVSYVSCDPTIVTVNATNGNVTALKGGKANITIKMAEGDKYLANEVNVTVTVNKLPVTITVDPTISVDYGKTDVIEASAGGHTLEFISLNETVVTVDGTGLITAIKGGVANVTVRFIEDDYYLGDEVNVTVTVNRLPIGLVITDADDVFVGGTSRIKLYIDKNDANGFVIVNVNGTDYPINISEVKYVDVVLDKVGDYDIIAIYQGDDKYQTSQSNPETIKAYPKHENALDVNVTQNIRTGDKVEINATSSSGAIEIYVDGENQTVIDGKAVINSLSVGKHTIQVISPETNEYVANSTEFTIDVDKKLSNIDIGIIGDLIVDSYIKLSIDYNGSNIVVYMDGKVIEDYEEAFKATSGDHLIVATVAEDEEYLGCSESYNFTVEKKPSEIYVSGTKVTVGGNTLIEVMDLPSDATGIVIIDLNGTKYSMNISETKSLSIILDKVGYYDLSAQYLGDEKYLPQECKGNPIFAEDKKASAIDIDYPDVIHAGDDVDVEVTSNNKVDVYLDGVKQTLSEGKFTIENVSAGTHVIEVISNETAEFKYNSTKEIFEVAKKQSEISIVLPQTIEIGNEIEINVTSYDGADIIVLVDGEKQTVTDGKVTIKATAGSHTIIASVDETYEYLQANANETFTVDKLPAAIEVSGENITQGQATTITVSTQLDEGIVVVKLNDTEVAIDLAKSKSTSIVLDAPGVYELSANYLGSDKYETAKATSSLIKVLEKVTPKVNVTIPEIKAGEDGVVNVSIPNATGSLHIIVDGVDEIVPLDENGTASYTIPEMGAGNHSVVVVYSGDDTHEAKVVTQTVEVLKQTTETNITTPKDVKAGENATVKVDIPGATGNVSVIVDGVERTVPLVNGFVEYPLDNLSGGNHSVVVIYAGDPKHESSYSTASFNVAEEVVPPKEKTNATISVPGDIKAGDNAPISVSIPNATGSVSVIVDGVETVVPLDENGTANYTIPDVGVGTHSVVVIYSGDETHAATHNVSRFVVKEKPVEIVDTHFDLERSYIESYSIDYHAGEKGKEWMVATLKDSKGNVISDANVEFTFNGVKYNLITDKDGIVKFQFNRKIAQVYTGTFVFLGDEKYNSSMAYVTVNVKKKSTYIVASSKTFKASAKTKKYTVTLKTKKFSSADGKVYLYKDKKVFIKINGKVYSGKTKSNGKVTFNIKLSKKGKYIAKVYFKADMGYSSSSKKVKITIK